MSWSGTVTCSHCYQRGHNKRKCPELTLQLKKTFESEKKNAELYRTKSETELGGEDRSWNVEWHEKRAERAREGYLKRTKIDLATGQKVTNKAAKAERMKKMKCGYCEHRGHTRRVCQNVKNDYLIWTKRTAQVRSRWLENYKETGIGIGTLIVADQQGYRSSGDYGKYTVTALVTGVEWHGIDAYSPTARVIQTKTNDQIKGIKNYHANTLGNIPLHQLLPDSDATKFKTILPTGITAPAPLGWLEDARPIKEVFPTSDERPWDFRGYDRDCWHSQLREELGLPVNAYDA
jgi:hypothetical protein